MRLGHTTSDALLCVVVVWRKASGTHADLQNPKMRPSNHPTDRPNRPNIGFAFNYLELGYLVPEKRRQTVPFLAEKGCVKSTVTCTLAHTESSSVCPTIWSVPKQTKTDNAAAAAVPLLLILSQISKTITTATVTGTRTWYQSSEYNKIDIMPNI